MKITGPPRFAGALKGLDGEAGARVLARGEGPWAEAIAASARRHGVPVLENAALARHCASLPLGAELPEALLLALACVLDALFELEEEAAEGPPETTR